MKVFFDTNVYVAEALLGEGAEAMVAATVRARGGFTPATICSTNSNTF